MFNPRKRDPEIFDRYGLSDKFRFLYVGRLSREKNLDGLLDAFDELLGRGHRVSLVIVGDGPYRRPLESRCQGRPAVFTGLLEGEALARTYASADAMVFPSTTDTFGNVVLEAQASGVPAIVTDRGGPADIVRRYDSGIIVDHDPARRAGRRHGAALPLRGAALRTAGPRIAQRGGKQVGRRARRVLDPGDARHARERTSRPIAPTDPQSAAGMIELDVA